MTGRDKFAKYRGVIRLFEAFYGCFPEKIQRWLFGSIRGRKGIWGIVSRYALVRNLAQECGDNVVIDENVYIFNIHNISFGNNVSINSMCYIDGFGGITIGSNVSIAHGSTIMSSSHKYQGLDTPIKYQGIDAAPVHIEDNVWIGAKATILYGKRIASGSIVGANSVVTKDIGVNEIWGGGGCQKDKRPMKRVLVITRGAWNNDNNTGNTLSNIFDSDSDFEFHNLYLRSENTGEHSFCKSIFRITEGQLINNIIKGSTCGELVNRENNDIRNTQEDKAYRLSKRVNFYTLWWGRELLWLLGKWNNDSFKQYVLSVAPDIVFMPVFGCFYPHKILAEVHRLTSAKVVLYHADDNYSLKQFSFSPTYWLFRFRLRFWVRRSVGIASANYSISSLQKEEYQRSLKKEFRLLQKFYDFSVRPEAKRVKNCPIRMVFSGNISSGRWRTLAIIGRALDDINHRNGEQLARLEIYTATELTDRMKTALLCNSVDFKGFVPSEQICFVQNNADILVHVESFDLKDKLEVRQSFSTKIVDYFSRLRCIFAVGPKDVASLQYLQETGAACVVFSESEVVNKLEELLRTEPLIDQYAEKAWYVGKMNHSLDRRTQFHKELLML